MLVKDLKLRPDFSDDDLKAAVRKKLKGTLVRSVEIVRKSIDARKSDGVRYVLSVLVNEPNPLKTPTVYGNAFSEPETDRLGIDPAAFETAVVGSGPAGLFAAIRLLRSGVPVTVYERGEPVEDRIRSVERFFETGKLDPESNVQFGEGGAGTFSDGKLNTGTHGPYNAEVLKLFYEFGAPEEILYDAKPHIGTDVLVKIVRAMRSEIFRLGGSVRFKSKVTDVISGPDGVRFTVNDSDTVKARFLILAVGHSARDTFETLHQRGFALEKKAFAVGVRIEHREKDISAAQYKEAASLLPPASYKLVGKGTDGRGVYSFCMCPGGFVVNASSEEGMTAVNGMSYSGRNGVNSNSALVVQVRTEDFPGDDPLSGVRFQQELERKAYREGQGAIPVQRFEDFRTGRETTAFGLIRPETKGAYRMANLNRILPEFVSASLKQAIPAFAKQINGFDDPDAILSAVETRTSSPVRILRNESMEAVNQPNVFPSGEGAGYSGGIVSSAADGLRTAEAVIEKIRKEIHGRETDPKNQ